MTPLPSYEEALAELAHLKAHAATMPIAFAPVPLGNRRPAVTGNECSACLVAPPYHEEWCPRREVPAHDLTAERAAWARYVDATIDDRDARFAEDQEQHGAEEWRERTKAALAAAKQALRALGVDESLLKSTEGT